MKEIYKFESDLSPPLIDGMFQVPPLIDDMFQVWKNTFNLRHFQKIASDKKLCKNRSWGNILSCTSVVEIKAGLPLSKKLDFICLYETIFKIMKNAFYFILKFFPFIGYLNFCPDSFGYVRKRLDKKANVDFKFYSNTHLAQYPYG